MKNSAVALTDASAPRLTSIVCCIKCRRQVELQYEPNPAAAWVAWTCPHRQTCGKLNHTELAGTLVGVERAK